MRDARGRFTDEEVEAMERAFGQPAVDQRAIDAMAGTLMGVAAVAGVRARALGQQIELAAEVVGHRFRRLLGA